MRVHLRSSSSMIGCRRCVPAFADATERRADAGRVRHQRRAARIVARGHLPLGEGRRAGSLPTPRPSTTSPSPTSTRTAGQGEEGLRQGARTRSEQHRRSDRTTSCSRKSMTGRVPKKMKVVTRLIGAGASWAIAAAPRSPAARRTYEIPIETPIQPKMDVTRFSARARRRVRGRRHPKMSTRTRKRFACSAASFAPSRSSGSSTRTLHAVDGGRRRTRRAAPAARRRPSRGDSSGVRPAAVAPARSRSGVRAAQANQGRKGSRAVRARCSRTPPTGSGSARNTRTR